MNNTFYNNGVCPFPAGSPAAVLWHEYERNLKTANIQQQEADRAQRSADASRKVAEEFRIAALRVAQQE